MTTPRPFAFRYATVQRADRRQSAAIFTCAKCGATHERVISNRHPPPEVVVKWAERDGWQADAFRPQMVLCPQCRHGSTSHSVARDPILKPEKALPMAEPKPPRDLTQAERLKIRSILDRQFDDSAGCYLDGYSDQRIGEELSVPWSLVARVREAAYGPIRVDPEIASFRAQVEQISRDIKALSDREAALRAKLDELQKRRVA